MKKDCGWDVVGRALVLALAVTLVGTLTLVSLARAEETGKALFTSKGCAACHGANAEGKVGPALAGHTEAEIVKTVRSGKGSMPAFPASQLSDADLHEIVEFIESLEAAGPMDEHHLKEALEALESNKVDQAKDEVKEAIEKASAERKAQEQAILADLNAGRVKEADAALRKLLGGEAEPTPKPSPAPRALPNTGDPFKNDLLIAAGLGGLALLAGGLAMRKMTR